MKKGLYPKGNCLTFPMELTQVQGDSFPTDNKYLYPVEVKEIDRKSVV